MRISVNLATRPFVELRPYFLRLRLFMGVLAVVGVGAIVASHLLQKKLDRAQTQMNQLHDQTFAAQQEKLHNEQRMRQPANAAVLDRAHFLNALFLHKSFSWTAVMMDLETVLPAGVQVTSIEPQISADGDVIIRMRVSGDRDRAVQLVRNLERSRRFLQPRLMGEALQARGTGGTGNAPGLTPNAAAPNAPGAGAAGLASGVPGGVEFEILANYNPLPAGEAYPRAARPRTAAGIEAEPLPAAPAGRGRSGAAEAASGRYGKVLKPYAQTHPAGSLVAPQGGAQ